MRILIDGIPDVASPEPGSTLGRILSELGDWLRREGRAVREFRLDGEVLTLARRSELSGVSADTFGELAVATADRIGMPLEILMDLRGRIGALEARHVRAAERLQAGEGRAGLTELEGCLADWTVFLQGAVHAATLAGVALPPGAAEPLRRISELLRELSRSLAAGDSVRTADLAEHELRPRLADLAGLLDGLIEAVRKAGGGSNPG